MFFYEKWDVFKAAVRLRAIADELTTFQTPRSANDFDQLRRAASSIVFNIAEGAKETHLRKKLDRYGTARASASECNGVLIVLEGSLPKAARELIEEGRDLADRISAMTTNLIRSTERNGHRDQARPRSRRKTQDLDGKTFDGKGLEDNEQGGEHS